MRQPYGTGSPAPMQLQTVRRSYRSADGYRRDAARMQAAGFLRTRQDAHGVTWERLTPWGTLPPVPPQVRERTPELWIVLGVFGALLLLMLILVVVSNAGNYAMDDTPTALVASPTPNRATATVTGGARPPTATPPAGVVPQPIVLPSTNPTLLAPSATVGPIITPIPIATPGATLQTASPLPPTIAPRSP